MDLLTVNDRPGQYPPSYYAAHASTLDPFPRAAGALTCDVCVVGGGFTGLSAALHLAQRGYDVVLLEAQRVGFGASGRNGGQVGQGQRLDQQELEKMLGRDHAHALWQVARQSVDLVRDLAASDLVHADFHPGIIHADHRERFVSHSHDYVRHMHEEYGYTAIRALDRDEMRHLVASDAYHGGSIYDDAGHIDPLELVLGLARMAVAAGVRIFERSKVSTLTEGDPALLRTDDAEITARHVVMGCNGYLGRLDDRVAARVMPINNYIIATEPLGPERQEALIRNNHAVADSKFVINYFRFSDDHRLLFGGTESYGYRFPSDIAAKVRKPMLEIFPQLADVRIDHAWGGTLGITMNRMPHFERLSGNVLSLSGFSGHGVALATLAGQIAAETIAGQAERFDLMARVPGRPFPGGPALRTPLLILAMLWFSLRDRL
ncbi:oxidoreductase, FAD-binding protein (plasmid) [Ruegeria pomeroyi DSS-3]|uniref:Oxidoreductase, FAD-binding protein n=2 Tax=Ruegeria pomeroyi TaxID=89184 RepID=Q5LL20_RUEPO|nr:FAD-binding oxidoreductase [Ruegeria pomeroyi]AAV97343.1 oxidoreductase, FAD-binding protein [Ruegeria pomeroyi DSS-3]NVK96815.1 FAD-binding oxidoreductase [Ruegeria pomeroyi]NVL02483.1 FAD-binding oxidoreductase [Ruegeria pomeroyi]HCE70416.1 FAD-binding oxidoreductase [Ruegeria sp.]